VGAGSSVEETLLIHISHIKYSGVAKTAGDSELPKNQAHVTFSLFFFTTVIFSNKSGNGDGVYMSRRCTDWHFASTVKMKTIRAKNNKHCVCFAAMTKVMCINT
jgi:hypothetical protein